MVYGTILFLQLCPLILGDYLTFVDDKTQSFFDWSSLQRSEPYEVADQGYSIKFNLGKSTGIKCGGVEGSVIRTTVDGCSNMGIHEASTIDEILNLDAGEIGLSITYRGTSRCTSSRLDSMRTTFIIACNIMETDFELTSDPYGCHLVFNKRDPAGCPISSDASLGRKMLYM